jgi:hypothetical protein
MVDHATGEGAEPRVFTDADQLRANVERSEAERRKLKLEADQIEKEMALPLFKRSGFVKAVAAGILALPLIWFYLDKVVIPYQNAKNELLSIENAKAKIELDDLHKGLETRRQELETGRQELAKMEIRLNGTLQDLKTAQERERSMLENLKREDKEVKTTAKITQMQNDLTRRERELDAEVSSLARIGEELQRPIVPDPTPSPAPAPERRLRLILDKVIVEEDGVGRKNQWSFTIKVDGREVMGLESRTYDDDKPEVTLNRQSEVFTVTGSSLQIEVNGSIPAKPAVVHGSTNIPTPRPGSDVRQVLTAASPPGSSKGGFRFQFTVQAIP